MYLQDHYACWLNRKQFFTLVNTNMNTHCVRMYVVYIVKWCYSLGCKIIAAHTFTAGGIQFHSPVCIFYSLSLYRSTWYIKFSRLIRCTYAEKKMNTFTLFTINNFDFTSNYWLYERGLLRAAKVIASIYFSTSSNREMIYRKSVLTLQMLHFILHTINPFESSLFVC